MGSEAVVSPERLGLLEQTEHARTVRFIMHLSSEPAFVSILAWDGVRRDASWLIWLSLSQEKWVKAAEPWLTSKNNEKT